MGTPSVGDVVIIPFPYSDLSQSKRRPALVITGVGMGDFLLCQITSKQYDDSHAISLNESDFLFAVSGETVSFASASSLRPMRFSLQESLAILNLPRLQKLLHTLLKCYRHASKMTPSN